MLKNTENRYGIISKLLHWALAVLILGLIWLGWTMTSLGYYDPRQPSYLQYHREFGMLVLMLVALKILWKFHAGSPKLDPSIRGWQRTAAIGAHHLLALLMLLIPVTGYFISTSAGAPIRFFGLFEIPAVLEVSTGLRDICITVHYYCAYGLLAVVIAHALAAIKHQFIDRDGTLARMIWR